MKVTVVGIRVFIVVDKVIVGSMGIGALLFFCFEGDSGVTYV